MFCCLFQFSNALSTDLEMIQKELLELECDEVIDGNSKLIKFLEDNGYDKYKRYLETKGLHKEILNRFKEEGIPAYFSFIPYNESGFNPKIKTKTVAGLWQFTAQSGRNFGLQVDKKNDERFDVQKSTEALIAILKFYHKQYHKWYLVDFAYGMGEGKLNKLIQSNNSDKLSTLLYDSHFPKGTKSHFATTLLLTSFVMKKIENDLVTLEKKVIEDDGENIKENLQEEIEE